MPFDDRKVREASSGAVEDGTGALFDMATITVADQDFPVYFIGFGDGTAEPTLASSANPFPVTGTVTQGGSWAVGIDSPLRSSRVDVAEVATEMEALDDQAGAGAVLTFTFASAVQLVWVRSVGDISRAVVGSQTPTATLGAYCGDDEPTPLTVNAVSVKVFAPVGATVSVWGMRFA